LCSNHYYLVFDATELWGSGKKAVSGPEVTPIDATIAVRTYSTAIFERRSEVEPLSRLRTKLYNNTQNSTAVIRELHSLAGDICAEDVESVTSQNVQTLTNADFEVETFKTAGKQIIDHLNKNYNLNLPKTFLNRLDTIVKFGASMLPLIGSIYTVCMRACEFERLSVPRNPSENDLTTLKQTSRDFTLSLVYFTLDVLLLWSGVGGKVAKTTVQTIDELLFEKFEKYVSREVYYSMLEWVYLLVEHVSEEEVGDGLQNYIRVEIERLAQWLGLNDSRYFQ
jgi:hypothetical protein